MSRALTMAQLRQLPDAHTHRIETELSVSLQSATDFSQRHHRGKRTFQPTTGDKVCTVWKMHPKLQGGLLALPFSWSHEALGQDVCPRRAKTLVAEFGVSDEDHAQGVVLPLRDAQKVILNEVCDLFRKQSGSALLAVYPGCGKTVMAIVLAWMLRVKTMILVHRLVLIDQWVESIDRVLGAGRLGVQVVDSTGVLDSTKDIFIMNICNVPKHAVQEYQPIGFLIVDECHLLVAQQLVQSLTFFFPRHLLGLSATPYRRDGLDVLLDFYFGKGRVHRQLHCEHTVWCLSTDLVIPTVLNARQQVDWNALLHTQSFHTRRNERIAELVTEHAPQRGGVLVLCKRIEQVRLLRDLLVDYGCTSVATFTSKDKTLDRESKILLTTFQKVGVGFSHERMDMLVLACDVEEYFLQYLGRVFRRPESRPLIVDIVDQHPILKRHFATRQKTYIACGGTVVKKKFPL